MEIREIKAFVTVAEELNFRKAAEALGMSQPPLTRLISQLEANLGVKLFHRTTRSVELTGEGVHFLKRGKEIIDEVSQVEKELKSLSKAKASTIRISFHPSTMHSEIPKLISSYKEQFPNVKFVVEELKENVAIKNLKLGKVDLAFIVNRPDENSFDAIEIATHELGFFIPNDNPLSRKSSIKFSDLQGQTFVFHAKKEHLGFQSEFHEFLRSKKISVKVYYKKQNESCSNLVITGKGILITSKKLVPNSSSATFVPLADFYPKLKVFGVWPKRNETPFVKALISFLEEKTSLPTSEMHYHFN